VAFAALSMAALSTGRAPRTLWLLLGLALATLLVELWRQRRGAAIDWKSTLVWTVLFPAVGGALVLWRPASMPLQALTTLVVVAPLGPLLYRLAYRPLADATVLMLLIVSVALHGVLVGLGLLFFGAEGSRTPAFSDLRLDLGGVQLTGQSLVVVGVTLVLVIAMFRFFGSSMIGKALRATAINRVGARLMGIPTELSGDLSFALASLIGAVSGLLIGPLTTVYYDTGFLIGLKGFVAAIVGGMASYPLALGGALLVGQLESFSSFWASAYKEVLVFTLIIPVLWWRSLHSHHVEDEE
jgi:branched-chain amino acid transport system permease protein